MLMSVLVVTLGVTRMLLVLTWMEVIGVNVLKDLKEMELIAMVCNSDIFCYDCTNIITQMQNIIFNVL
jgi:hypothetical protein